MRRHTHKKHLDGGVLSEAAADLLLMHLARMLVLTWWYTVGGKAR